MPRYAKGSFQEALYEDILGHAAQEIAVTRTNGTPSRAHRNEALTLPEVPLYARVNAVKAMCRLHENRWVTDENFVIIVGDIVGGK